jgi:thioredoxin-like negative regulator of GroEL
VRLKPTSIAAHLNLGIALFHQHLNEQALDQFDEVLRRDSKNQVALNYTRLLLGSAHGAPQNQ